MATPSEQVQAMRGLREGWDGYGAAAPHDDALSLAREFVDLLEALLRKTPSGIQALHVNPTRVGGVLIEWEDPVHEHEIDVNPDRSISFLHRHKTTGRIDTRKFSPDSPAVIHPGILQELRELVVAA
jgi:hypothetical protein